MNTIVLLTSNSQKLAEYRHFFARYKFSVELSVAPTGARPDKDHESFESEARRILAAGGVRAVIMDTSDLYQMDGSPIDPNQSGAVKNICKVTAWILPRKGRELGTEPVRYSSTGIVIGTVDGTKLAQGGSAVFGWDDSFRPRNVEATLHDMREKGLKCSAREVALSKLAQDHMSFSRPRVLRWSGLPESTPVEVNLHLCPLSVLDSFGYTSFRFHVRGLDSLGGILSFLANKARDSGVHFRTGMNRRAGNYWYPGLNGGIPFTPRPDPIHEVTYLFHDLAGHYTMPDFVFDGSRHPMARAAYLVRRLLSESWSIVVGDMLFVDYLFESGVDYDFSKRRVWPLYRVYKDRNPGKTAKEYLLDMSRAMARYVMHADLSGFPDCQERAEFQQKYRPFFSADWMWAASNIEDLFRHQERSARWVKMVGADTIRSVGLVPLDDAAIKFGNIDNYKDLVDAVLEDHHESIFQNASVDAIVSEEQSIHNRFSRYWLGQLAVYAEYGWLLPTTAGFNTILSRIKDGPSSKGWDECRNAYTFYLDVLRDLNLISPQDHANYRWTFPHFEPMFVDYKRTEKPLEEAILEAASRFSVFSGLEGVIGNHMQAPAGAPCTQPDYESISFI